MRKVISYSLWGSDPKYCKGILHNADLARTFYPGWIVSVYADSTVPMFILVELASKGAQVFAMPDSVGFRGLFWRMLPACDPTIDLMICRDADSRPSERERSAVTEWEASGKPFHSMRDHRAHGVPILGGMWGCRPAALPWFRMEYDAWIAAMQPGDHRRGLYFDQDQQFLRHAVWPMVCGVCIAHDDAGRYGGDVRPFPAPMIHNHFVGEIYDAETIG